MSMDDLDRIFPMYDDDEVSDKDLRAITAINTGGPVPMAFPDDDGPAP
jgi:hypothetical protein